VGQQGAPFFAATNEDNVAIHWAWSRQDPFWCPIPAVVRHDITVPSSLGFDHHPMRTPLVLWEDAEYLTEPSSWVPRKPPPYVAGWMTDGEMAYVRRMLGNGAVRVVNADADQSCWFCLREPGVIMGNVSGCKIGRECMAKIAGVVQGTEVVRG